MQLVEHGHHETRTVVVTVDCDSVRLGEVVGPVEVWDDDVSTRVGREWDPVVQSVEGSGFVQEHVFPGVLWVVVEGVDLARDLALSVSHRYMSLGSRSHTVGHR